MRCTASFRKNASASLIAVAKVYDVSGAQASVRKSHLRMLEPYLLGEHPREDGEWDMYCPLHEDSNRSAQLNIGTGIWFCHAGCGGGRVTELIARRDEWKEPKAARAGGKRSPASTNGGEPAETITEAQVAGWVEALQANDERLEEFIDRRGLTNETVLHFEIGWDSKAKAYTIPVRGHDGEFWNIRRYQLDPPKGRRKIWGVKGMNEVRLYPVQVLDDPSEFIVICEGELDAAIANQEGYPAITRTGAVGVWQPGWNEHFRDRVVYICHDKDEGGREGTVKVGRALRGVAREVRVINLPFEQRESHGQDLTDFFTQYDAHEFSKLLDEAEPFVKQERPEDLDPTDASVLDSFDSRKVGSPLRLTLTVKGRRDPGYSVPAKTRLTCTRDAGAKCQFCPMNGAQGEATDTIEPGEPVVLELMDSSRNQVSEILRRHYGAMKCEKLEIEVEEHQSVEVLYARPSVEHVRDTGQADQYKNTKITSVGRHDTPANTTVRVVGALYPDPRRQLNEFMAWDVDPLETTLDNFELSPKEVKALKRFQPGHGQRPLKKLGEISRALAAHVTHIYGRPEMHALIDLIFHSVLEFDFADEHVERGWLEGLIVGDTRTGKSEAATSLARHYGAGEVVSCESATFAGILGGLQQYGANKEWAISWGVVPLNDRRLVVLDEVGGLDVEDIGRLSDVRSRGLAQLTKIQTEATPARTRLLWLGNPRNTRMAEYTYGVQALRPLIGNNEDIARFDIAMSVVAGEVPMAEINKQHATGQLRYTAPACRALLRWAWSRRPEHVTWARGAEAAVYRAAQALGQRYVEDPPLVQGANVRIKVARIAAALAARTFSTKDGRQLVITPAHVKDSVVFLDRVYGMTSFGYKELSHERLSDEREARKRTKSIKEYLKENKGLAKFLRGQGKFRRQDLEEIMNVERVEANAIINRLWSARMVRKEGGDVRVEPTLHQILREVK